MPSPGARPAREMVCKIPVQALDRRFSRSEARLRTIVCVDERRACLACEKTWTPPQADRLLTRNLGPRRRVNYCPRCGLRVDVWSSQSFHKHGHKNVALVPRVLRVVSPQVRPELVDEAIAWLDERWRGEVYVPDELLPLVATV